MTDATLPRLALSVRQPWAWAIISGGKPVENRDWRKPNPGLKQRGPVAIHASSGMTRAEYHGAADFMASIGVTCPPPHELVLGAIVGAVEIVDVVREANTPWFFGPVGLLLANPRACTPIPVKGALGFFQWAPGGDLAQPAKWMLPATDPAAPAAIKQGSLL